MNLGHFSEGELCLPTRPVACKPHTTHGVDTSSTSSSVMSRGCEHCRFHRYVAIMESTPCWLWLGTFYSQASRPTYGQFWLDGRRVGAHRASYEIHVGPVPTGLDILHSCDTKACVNPAHLRPGTHAQNIREAFDKLPAGRFAGENNGRAKLDWPRVHAIRSASDRGESYASLSRQYGVSAPQIRGIVLRTKWPESKCPIHGALEEAVA